MSPKQPAPRNPWGTIQELRSSMESFELGDGSQLGESHRLRPFREKDDALETHLVKEIADGLCSLGYDVVSSSRPELGLRKGHWERFAHNWHFEGYRTTAEELKTIGRRYETEVGFHITSPLSYSLLREFWAFSPHPGELGEFDHARAEEFHLGLSPEELVRYMTVPSSLLDRLEDLGFDPSDELRDRKEEGGDDLLLVQVDLRGFERLDQAIAGNISRDEARAVYYHETDGYDGEPLSELKCLMTPHSRCFKPVAVIERKPPSFRSLGFHFR